ncbi:hypothetical protein D3C76_1273740 [compost metagenome]
MKHQTEVHRIIDIDVLHQDVLEVPVPAEEPDRAEVLVIVDFIVGPDAGPEIPAGTVQRNAVDDGILVAKAQRIVTEA